MKYPHLLLDCKDVTVSDTFLNDRAYIKAFMNHLLDAIDMQPLGRLHIEFLDAPEELVGYSAVRLIKTSSMVLHVFPYDQTVNLDVFSCKEFSSQVVIDLVRRYFEPGTVSSQVIFRGFSEI